jgi:hypothetical protein
MPFKKVNRPSPLSRFRKQLPFRRRVDDFVECLSTHFTKRHERHGSDSEHESDVELLVRGHTAGDRTDGLGQ